MALGVMPAKVPSSKKKSGIFFFKVLLFDPRKFYSLQNCKSWKGLHSKNISEFMVVKKINFKIILAT